MAKQQVKMKDFKIFKAPAQSGIGNAVRPENDFITFNKEDIEQSVAARFEEQVRRYRDKIAVKGHRRELTYKELNQYANRVAHNVIEKYNDSGRLNSNEKCRYSRQMMLHQWGMDSQEKLKNTTVFCAGAGGSGSPLIMQLALAGFGTIIISDFDEVELSNLNRQVLHDESRIGMNKALSAAETVKRINPNIKVIAYDKKIDADTIRIMAEGADFIFDNVDDMEAKFILSQYAVEKKIPHVISSMIDMNAYAAIFHSPHTPCFHCLNDRNVLDEVAEIKKVVKDYKKNPNPVVSPALFMATAFAVNEVIKIVLGFDKQKPAYNKYFFFNQRGTNNIVNADSFRLITYSYGTHFRNISKEQGFDWDEGWSGSFLDEIELSHNPCCPACSDKAELEPLPPIDTTIGLQPILITNRTEIDDSKDLEKPDLLQSVALLFEHGADMVVGLMGVLKAGKVYVPLDPTYPDERLDYMLEDSDARLIVTNDNNYSLACRLKETVNKNIAILNIDKVMTDETFSGENLSLAIAPNRLAYILYTSGSTGKPKGVMQNQRNVLHFCRVYTNALHINSDDRLSLFSSYGFDAAKMDIYGALLNGATLFPFDIKGEGNLGRMVEWLQEEKITIYHSIPTVYRYFTDMITGEEDFSSMRFIVLGGEAVFKKDIDVYKKHFGDHCLFINGLGPTESTVTLQYFMNKETDIKREAVPVGYAVDETEVLLIDERGGEPEGYGVGEIVYKSEHLALGYWNNPEKTKEVFGKNPLTGRDRVYHSGDLGRRLMDGSLEYVGRKDFQVKVMGYRVELGEIEGRLDNFHGIKKSAVVCKQLANGENYLTAYYVLSNETDFIDEGEIAAQLKQAVPDYMVPGAFYRLDEFPLTATGKIDRKVLAESVQDLVLSQEEYVPPKPGIETTLAQMWTDLLKLEKIGSKDNFFVLGGNSLKAMAFTSAIHKEMDVKIPLAQLFKTPTIEGVADFISASDKTQHIEIEKVGEKEYYALSSAQKRMLVENRANPNSLAYNMSHIVVLEGKLDVAHFENCFRQLVSRHETLRTSFHITKSEAVQKIHTSAEIDFKAEYYDISNTSNPDPSNRIKAFIRLFDLSVAPLFRVGIIKLEEEKYVLMVNVHHIVSDGLSNQVLIEELGLLYHKYTLPTLKLQYKDFAEWENKLSISGEMKKQENFWLKELGGEIPRLSLPSDGIVPTGRAPRADAFTITIKEESLESLRKLATEESVTLFTLMFALLNVFLAKLSGQEDIIIGTVTSGRRHTDLESVIGMFVNTLAVRSFPRYHLSFRNFLGQFSDRMLEAFENQDYQYEELVERLQIPRDNSRNPIFDVMFSWPPSSRIKSAVTQEMELQTKPSSSLLKISPYVSEKEGATIQYHLLLTVIERKKSMYLNFAYNADLFNKDTIERFESYYVQILEQVLKDREIRLEDIKVALGMSSAAADEYKDADGDFDF